MSSDLLMHQPNRWQFWIDRGGTFTDVVAQQPDGGLSTLKLLSENPEHYADAAIAAIRHFLNVPLGEPIPSEKIAAVKMGTTVATNALLERKGEPTLLVITKGFGDQLRIAYQNRPHIFARKIVLPELLYQEVIEIDERIAARGEVIKPLDGVQARAQLQAAYDKGLRSVAIVLMHGYRYHQHELQLAQWARAVGFTQVSLSHQVSPLMKLVARGDTTVVDAYLSPILRRYVNQVAQQLPGLSTTQLLFMQSSGGLTAADNFAGKDSILSGPAGGIVGMVRTAQAEGFDKIIGFDMGGTSTDVSHFAGEFERSFETQVAGVRMRAPMMSIHTVAAGGGSILHFDGSRFRVGPDSAGANPGPACYRRDGPLTVTDCNVMLGKIVPDYFPKIFGKNGNQALDAEIVRARFKTLSEEIVIATGVEHRPEQVAEGFLKIAIDNMANAIKKVSVARGYDITHYTLQCFGGAGGQHACLVADALGMARVLIHPYAGVLSAYGMGLADVSVMREHAVEHALSNQLLLQLEKEYAALEKSARAQVLAQGLLPEHIHTVRRVHVRYVGTDSALIVTHGSAAEIQTRFEAAYKMRYSFLMQDKALLVEAVSVEVIGREEKGHEEIKHNLSPISNLAHIAPLTTLAPTLIAPKAIAHTSMVCEAQTYTTPIYQREQLSSGTLIQGPAIIAEINSTTILEPQWQAQVSAQGSLILTRSQAKVRAHAMGTQADPVMLEIFNNLFMAVAEQMGLTLANTAYSVNIKERLDFSCALFDAAGNLIANAPHMPVHLGSMGESIKTVMRENAGKIRPGNVYMLNAPYNGGTHLPDITVITPVFDKAGQHILFYVGARGHHADIGGISPGSMPPNSKVVEEEGVLIDNFLLVENGQLRDAATRTLLASGRYPSRNIDQNMADLRAMIAANAKGVHELHKMADEFGLPVVNAYMRHVQDNAEEAVRRVIAQLAQQFTERSFEYEMDHGAVIRVNVTFDLANRSGVIDFTGTSKQLPNNFNAPASVCYAAVLYVFRSLVDDDIPLNAGCLKPLQLIIPEGSMLNPHYPAAVVAGNVETSQCLTDTLYGALGVMAASQGTMNNFTFGNQQYQYYETIAAGSGAGDGFHGCTPVQTHMTNSRMTDPEVLEWRFPVRVEAHSIRAHSGGKGKWKGGDGAVRKIRFLETMTASLLTGHRRVPPYGMAGGQNGEVGRNWLERANGEVQPLQACDEVNVQAGDCVVIQTPSAGGFGVAE